MKRGGAARGPARALRLAFALAALAALKPADLAAIPFDAALDWSPEASGATGGLAFTNDAFGALPGIEWDDLDSYGFRGKVELPARIWLSGAASGITWRGESAGSGSRVDRLGLALTKWHGLRTREGLSAAVAVSLGLDALGDWHIDTLQSGWHGSQGIERRVPENYEGGPGLRPVLAAAGNLALAGALSPFAWASIEGTYPDAFTALGGIGLSYARKDLYLATLAGLRSSAYGGASPSMAALSSAENGLYIRATMSSGAMAFSWEAYPLAGSSNGSLTLAPLSGGRKTAQLPARARTALSFGYELGAAPTVEVGLELSPLGAERPSPAAILLGVESGWIGLGASGESAPRFTALKAGAGLRARSPGGLADALLGIVATVSFEDLRALTVERSAVLGSRLCGGLGLQSELRLHLPGGLFRGAGIGLRGALTPGFVLHRDSVPDFADRGWMEAVVFLFSEN